MASIGKAPVIHTLHTTYGAQTANTHEMWVQAQAVKIAQNGYGSNPQLIQPITEVAVDAKPAIARLNHSRWLADCPNGDRGAMLLNYDQPYMCPYCCNVDIGGRWRPVEWPTNIQEIERCLEKRMLPHTRNWEPGETIWQLRKENREHPEHVWRGKHQ